MFCKRCGYHLSAEDFFCPNCGCKSENVNSTQMPTQKDHLDTTSTYHFFKANQKAITIVSILFIIFISVLSFHAYKNHQKDMMWKTYKTSQSFDSDYLSEDIDFSPSHTYENSTYKIGTTMPAGEYVLFASSGGGYFCLSGDSSGSDIICNDNFNYNSIITVKDGEYLKLNRCYAEPINSAETVSISGDGMFKVGEHLSAGEYKLQAADTVGGYYCVYNDGRHDDIETNDNFDNVTYVTVHAGQYLLLSHCKIVK